MILRLMTESEADKWDNFVNTVKYSTALQYYNWAKIKSTQGWSAVYASLEDDGSMVGCSLILYKRIPFMGSYLGFCPFGPILAEEYINELPLFLNLLSEEMDKMGIALLKIHPYRMDIPSVDGLKIKRSKKLLYKETYVTPLDISEEVLYSRLHKKLRNDIKRAEKLGTEIVTDESLAGLEKFYELHKETFDRTDYHTQPFGMFEQLHKYFISTGKATIRFAMAEGKPISAAIFLKTDNTYLYMWGASTSDKNYDHYCGQKYLLWKSFLDAKRKGIKYFDLGGVTVNAKAGSKSEGIHTFKKRFGGDKIEMQGTLDIHISKFKAPLIAAVFAIYRKFVGL